MKKLSVIIVICLAVLVVVVLATALKTEAPIVKTPPEQPTDSTPVQPQVSLQTYQGQGFTVGYRAGFTPNQKYVYQALGPGKDIPGVSFTIPATLAAGTNLSKDSYISVEKAKTKPCDIGSYLDAPTVSTVTDNGVMYTVGKGGGAGAGNLYDETVYLLPSPNCTAIRYFIHSTNIGNYPPGMVTAFDKAALLAQFDTIRHSYRITEKTQ